MIMTLLGEFYTEQWLTAKFEQRTKEQSVLFTIPMVNGIYRAIVWRAVDFLKLNLDFTWVSKSHIYDKLQ